MIGYIITAIIAFIAGTIFRCYFDVEIKDEEDSMKDTKVKRLLYQESEAFKEGVNVGKIETIEKAVECEGCKLFSL